MAGSANYDIGIVGLGYVGLTLATVLAEAGYSVIGVEKRSDLVEMTNQGIPHFTEAGLPDALSGVTRFKKLVAAERFDSSFSCDTYIITVGTPLSLSLPPYTRRPRPPPRRVPTPPKRLRPAHRAIWAWSVRTAPVKRRVGPRLGTRESQTRPGRSYSGIVRRCVVFSTTAGAVHCTRPVYG